MSRNFIMPRNFLEDFSLETEDTAAWSHQAAQEAETDSAYRKLFAAVIHQAVMDTTMDPNTRDATEIYSAFHFLFDQESFYFEFLRLDQRRFTYQLLARMRDLSTPDDQFNRTRKENFLANRTRWMRAKNPFGVAPLADLPCGAASTVRHNTSTHWRLAA